MTAGTNNKSPVSPVIHSKWFSQPTVVTWISHCTEDVVAYSTLPKAQLACEGQYQKDSRSRSVCQPLAPHQRQQDGYREGKRHSK